MIIGNGEILHSGFANLGYRIPDKINIKEVIEKILNSIYTYYTERCVVVNILPSGIINYKFIYHTRKTDSALDDELKNLDGFIEQEIK
jgi:hypothetical protein